MKLETLLSGIDITVLQSQDGWENVEITGVAKDSRVVQKGELFVCIKGFQEDGHEHLWEAYAKNVEVYVVEKRRNGCNILEFPKKAVILQVKDSREAYAVMSANFWKWPSESLRLIGITGTKGKTTVSFMIKTLLEQQGERVGIIGTLGIFDGEKWIPERNTTPDAFTIHKYFDKMKDKGCKFVIIEVSSQGMKHKRVHGLTFEIAVFTNLTKDHIGPGEHRSMAEYRYWKSRLFEQCEKGICNLDDLSSAYMFRRKRCKKYGYTRQKAWCPMRKLPLQNVLEAEKVEEIQEEKQLATRFWIEQEPFELNMPGLFNVENALAALLVMKCLSYDISTMKKSLSDFSVNGRIERINNKFNIACYIDYAHNGESLKKTLTALRAHCGGRLYLVFGCGGNRGKDRRKEMGKVAGTYADYVIITNDNPRYEDPMQIAKEIAEGVRKKEISCEILLDRKRAIEQAVELAEENDVIIIAGKGHENYQEIKGMRCPMDDHELLAEALNKRKE